MTRRDVAKYPFGYKIRLGVNDAHRDRSAVAGMGHRRAENGIRAVRVAPPCIPVLAGGHPEGAVNVQCGDVALFELVQRSLARRE